MTRKLITCHADDNVENAMKAMAQYQLRRIPVVDENMKLVGIISQADVATRVDEPERTAEVVKEISQRAKIFQFHPKLKVSFKHPKPTWASDVC